jgi:putative transposase
MDQKTLFISDYLSRTLSFTGLCELYHVSRKTDYKWVARYSELGASGLEDRTRRPHSSPYQTPPELVAAILEARRRHPTWGAKKLLARRQPVKGRAAGLFSRSACEALDRASQRRLSGHCVL